MKRIISFCLTLVLVLSIFSLSFVSTQAEEIEVVETGVSDYVFELSDQGYVITKYTGTDTEVVIPTEYDMEPVVGIKSQAFVNCKAITDVIIPDGILFIEDYAFYLCSSLHTVGVGSTVTSIGDLAFFGCSSLADIETNFNTEYKSIDGVLFDNDMVLIQYPQGKPDTSYSLPKGTTGIKEKAFYGNTTLTTLVINAKVKTIVSNTFSNVPSLTTVTLGDSVQTLGEYAFDGSNVKTINLGKVTSIETGALLNCSKLVKVTVPSTVTTIGKRALGYYKDKDDLQYYRYDNFTIVGDRGSQAHIYARDNQITFMPVFDGPSITSFTPNEKGVKISWMAYKTSTTYQLYYKTSKSAKWSKLAKVKGKSYVHTGLTNNINYIYTIRAYLNSSDLSGYNKDGWENRYFSAPKLKSVYAVSNGIKFVWKARTGASCYNVYYKEDGSSWKKLGITSNTSFVMSTAKLNSKYKFTVRVADDQGKNVSYYNKTGLALNYLPAPKKLKVTNYLGYSKISWGKVSGATIYRLEVNDGTSWKTLVNTSKTSYKNKSVINNTAYSYRVRCITKDLKSYRSYYDTIVINEYFDAPKLSSITNGAESVTFKWKKVEGISSYKVLYKDNGGDYIDAGIVNTNKLVLNDVIKGHEYQFTIRCVKDDKVVSRYNTPLKKVFIPSVSVIT